MSKSGVVSVASVADSSVGNTLCSGNTRATSTWAATVFVVSVERLWNVAGTSGTSWQRSFGESPSSMSVLLLVRVSQSRRGVVVGAEDSVLRRAPILIASPRNVPEQEVVL